MVTVLGMPVVAWRGPRRGQRGEIVRLGDYQPPPERWESLVRWESGDETWYLDHDLVRRAT